MAAKQNQNASPHRKDHLITPWTPWDPLTNTWYESCDVLSTVRIYLGVLLCIVLKTLRLLFSKSWADEFGAQLIQLPDHNDRYISIPAQQPAHILAVSWKKHTYIHTRNMIMLKFLSVNEADVLCLMNGERNKKWMWDTNIQKIHLLQWTIEILFIQDVAFSVIGQKSVSVLSKFNEQMQLSLIFLVCQNLSPCYS